MRAEGKAEKREGRSILGFRATSGIIGQASCSSANIILLNLFEPCLIVHHRRPSVSPETNQLTRISRHVSGTRYA